MFLRTNNTELKYEADHYRRLLVPVFNMNIMPLITYNLTFCLAKGQEQTAPEYIY